MLPNVFGFQNKKLAHFFFWWSHFSNSNFENCKTTYKEEIQMLDSHSHTTFLFWLALQTYIWHRRVGQLAGIKLDPEVPYCSMGLKAILKASPTVLHQWENMDCGQGKQPGASHTPGGLHLLSLYTLAHLCSAWHIVPCAHMPVVPDYTCMNTRLWRLPH